MLFNYHTHTKRCRHAVGEDREYVEKAIQRGIQVLGFADHAPYLFPNTDYYSSFRMFTDELESYAESVRALQKEYAKDIRILCGFELEYYPAYHEEEKKFLSKINPDYFIMGQHFAGNEINTPYVPYMQGEENLVGYISQILEGLKTGDFLYLAHPDLAGYRYPEEVWQREYRRLCEGAKALNIPLEINLLGLKTKRHYPDRKLFKIAAEVGNKVLLGFDVHDPQSFCDIEVEEEALQIVEELGLDLITTPILK